MTKETQKGCAPQTKGQRAYTIIVYSLAVIGFGTITNTVKKGFEYLSEISRGRRRYMNTRNEKKNEQK